MTIKHLLPIALLCALVLSAAGQAYAAEKPEQLAQAATEKWLALTDGGKNAESWQTAAAYFKVAVSESQWQAALDSVRKPLGALVSRKLKSAKYTTAIPGAPDGEYVILQYDTAFANKKEAVETITPMLDKDGVWRVSGYLIR